MLKCSHCRVENRVKLNASVILNEKAEIFPAFGEY